MCAIRTIDANHIVGANFRLVRALRGWTQDETAQRLAPYLGHVLPKASISAIERVMDRDRRRVFDAQELVAFALAFDVPIAWFFLPVPGMEGMRIDNVEIPALGLLSLLLGRQDQLDLLRDRIAELRDRASPDLVEQVLDAVAAGDVSWHDVEASRLAAIQQLAGRAADSLETLIGELRQVRASFDDVCSVGYGEATSVLRATRGR